MQDKHGLLTAPIPQVLSKMTLPMILGIIAILLMNLADAYFIALLGTEPLAAISYTFPVTFGLNSITMGVGLGLSTFVGRYLGKGDTESAARYSSHGIILAVLLIILTSYYCIQNLDQIFSTLGAAPELLPLIREYMVIWFVAIPLLVVPMTGNAAIRATGDTKTPSKIMLVAAIVNAVLDPLFIFGIGFIPGLGMKGAAIASGISWAAALAWSLNILIKRERLLKVPNLLNIVGDWFNILKIGTPAALSNAMAPLAGAILMKIVSSNGIAAVAAYGAAQRLESLLLIVTMALTSVVMPFMAQNLGAGNKERTFAGLFLSMRFIIVFQLFVFITLVPVSSYVASLFSDDSQVTELIWIYLVLVPFSYGFQGVMALLVSAFNAMHKPIEAFKWSAMRLFIFTLPLAALGNWIFDIEGMFVGIALGNFFGGVVAYMSAIKLRDEHGFDALTKSFPSADDKKL